MTGFEFGDVILVPFPFTDHSTTKQRPAVVVSSGAYHHRRPDLIMMAISSQLHSAAFGDTPITEWQAAGLLKPSMLKPLVATVDQHLVRRKLVACNLWTSKHCEARCAPSSVPRFTWVGP